MSKKELAIMRYLLAIIGSIVILFGCAMAGSSNAAMGNNGAFILLIGFVIALMGAILAARKQDPK